MADPWGYEEKASAESMKKLRELWERAENQNCADCGAGDTKWASANIGVFICTKCSSVHRNLGPEVSTVLGVTMNDAWTDSQVECMLAVEGNAAANAIFEAYPPKDILKPGSQSPLQQRTEWIRRKYDEQEFLIPSLRIKSSKSYDSDRESRAVSRTNSIARVPSGRISRSSSKLSLSRTDVEDLGQLKVTVRRGRNLVVKDFRSSDPYVKVSILQQVAQTKVIDSNLNPVWDEELVLSVPDLTPVHPVKLQVLDKDLLIDDAMGEAEVDINPLVEAARMYEGVNMDGGRMQIGRWLATSDNALTGDSSIWLCDGKISQEITLKLQNVASGELDIALEWIPTLE